MCGITGIFSFENQDRTWPHDCLNHMVQAISHRGPDGTGTLMEPGLFLGHSRLAVLDLSPAGKQPMQSSNSRYVITFNGEIYNFRELRSELQAKGHVFSTGTDTEVLVAAWCQWGTTCVDRLDGIFAFALYDRLERRLHLVRDHLGVKPLFYRETKECLLFASEPLALLGQMHDQPELAPEDLDCYFTFNYLPAPRTGLKGVHQLSGGHMLTADAKGIRISRYWAPEYPLELPDYNQGLTKDFEATLAASVRSQTVSDAPLGLFLSGGLDSYAVAQSAITSGITPMAFTLGFDNPAHDERPAAAEYASHLGIQNNAYQFVWNGSEIRETLGAMGELLADSSCFPIYQLSRYARRQATVILAGDGGDELLAGYDTYRASEITPLVRCLPSWATGGMKRIARLLPSDSQRYGKRMIVERFLSSAAAGVRRDHVSFRRIFWDEHKLLLYDPAFLESVRHSDPVGEYAALMDEVPKERSYLTARQHADLLFHLPSILAKVDRMSMACGLEVRVPLLSKKMLEFCCRLPDAAKRSGSVGKLILREAIARHIPSSALKRPKAGFLPPVDSWFRVDGPMIEVFGDFLAEARSRALPLLCWDEVERFWGNHRRGKVDGGFVLLGILQYINWSQKCRI